MEQDEFFVEHYEFIFVVSYIATIAMVIFMMKLSTAFHIGVLVVAGLFFGWILHSGRAGEPPCGTSVDFVPIVRHTGTPER
jgi:hypothetical protein